ncbi:MAG: hypothetical protein M1830_000862, partial [Pleopsidium flavum]
DQADTVDLDGRTIAPGYLELQTNGVLGFHFTHFEDDEIYRSQLEKVSKYLVSKGVTGFWATIPTVSPDKVKKLLPSLTPKEFAQGASLRGAHVEGPFLAPSKRGAHNADLFLRPDTHSPEYVYGEHNLKSNIKLATLAPEFSGSFRLISSLTKDYGIVVSLGHSAADYDIGVSGINAGASALTHVFNAMNPFHHRKPGLAGLISSPSAPYYSVIPDGIHLHPATLTTAYRANPEKCILITDSIEMAGLPDGVYPGHAQIAHSQRKRGNEVTIDGTDTLIGSCIGLDECVRNLNKWSGCTLAEAVRCVTENIADMMGEQERGKLEVGRRADFVVLDDDGEVLQTWIKGIKVYERV